MCTSKSDCSLGFRTWHDFNLALDAKKGWQMLKLFNGKGVKS